MKALNKWYEREKAWLETAWQEDVEPETTESEEDKDKKETIENTKMTLDEENPEELEKKYIIEIDKVDGDTCRVKEAKWWIYRADLEHLEEYKGE